LTEFQAYECCGWKTMMS